MECLEAVDVDDSGLANIADVMFELAFLFSGGATPPAPYPGCGPDGTVDSLDCDPGSLVCN